MIAIAEELERLEELAGQRRRAREDWKARTAEIARQVARAREAGATVEDCAQAVGVTKQGIYHLLQRRGR